MKLLSYTIIIVIGLYLGAFIGLEKLNGAASKSIKGAKAACVWVSAQWKEEGQEYKR